MESGKFTRVSEVTAMISETMKRVSKGEVTVEAAHLLIRAANTMNTTLSLRLEHARLTGRLVRGSDVLPSFRFDEE